MRVRGVGFDASVRGKVVAVMAGDASAVTDGAYTLFVADFDDTDTALAAYQELKSLEDGATVAIDGVIVVKPDAADRGAGTAGHRPQHQIGPDLGVGRPGSSWA